MPAHQTCFKLNLDGVDHDFQVLAFNGREAISQRLCEALEEAASNEHSGVGELREGYRNTFRAISGSVPFRPFIEIDPGGVTVSGPLVKLNSGGAPASGNGALPNLPGLVKEVLTEKAGELLTQKLADPVPLAQLCQKPEGGTPMDCPLPDCGCRKALQKEVRS
ncbi:hypothetical protein BZK31_13310 [Pseudomonas floridensis]|uniref:Uncharacterized protein n=1 Tax=Pseudomonas floridensis TaxID=1958950 RepID=A0A1X0N5C2_9PSED|nr:hypothetical protein BZK31_13310 [Pseudomonas floridensis]